MANTPTETENRFIEDIEKIDEITLLAANILSKLEQRISEGNFDPDKFEQEISNEFSLDETRRTLLGRAMQKYKEAIKFTGQAEIDPTSILKQTNLQLDKYDGITASMDPKRPGVLVIRVESKADTAQLDTDIMSESEKMAENMANTLQSTEIGASYIPSSSSNKGGWIGKSISLDSLGFSENPPIIDVIAVCEEQEEEEKENVLNHEYAHAIHKGIIKPYIHRYLSAGDFKTTDEFSNWINKFSSETRDKLLKTLGDIKTDALEGIIKRINDPAAEARHREMMIDFSFLPNITNESSLEKELDSELWEALYIEQKLLDEMRAYSFSHPIKAPNDKLIRDISMAQHDRYDHGPFIDENMAERFLKLHLLVLKSYFCEPSLRSKVINIIGVAQTLTQATRLIEDEVNNTSIHITSKEQLRMLIGCLTYFVNGQQYTAGNAEIPINDVCSTILPTKDEFQKIIDDYGEDEKEETLEYFKKLCK